MYSQFSESSELIKEFYANEELIFSWIMPSITETYYIVRAKRILEKHFLMIPCVNVLREVSETFLLPYSILRLVLWTKYQLLRIEYVILDFLLKYSNILVAFLIAMLIFELLWKLISLFFLAIEEYVPVLSLITSLIATKYMADHVIKELHSKLANKLRVKIVNRLENEFKKAKMKIEILHAILSGVYPQIVQS